RSTTAALTHLQGPQDSAIPAGFYKFFTLQALLLSGACGYSEDNYYANPILAFRHDCCSCRAGANSFGYRWRGGERRQLCQRPGRDAWISDFDLRNQPGIE